jgi:hypothetical protein
MTEQSAEATEKPYDPVTDYNYEIPEHNFGDSGDPNAYIGPVSVIPEAYEIPKDQVTLDEKQPEIEHDGFNGEPDAVVNDSEASDDEAAGAPIESDEPVHLNKVTE